MYGAICICLVLFYLIGFVGGWYYGKVKTKIAGYLRIDVRDGDTTVWLESLSPMDNLQDGENVFLTVKVQNYGDAK